LSKQLINTAKVNFQTDGSPVSSEFDDIYFDASSTCSQSEQVFINANNIDKRWQQLSKQSHTADSEPNEFVIAETGFGTGLKFFTYRRKIHCL